MTTKQPQVGQYYDAEEQALIEAIELEQGDFVSTLTPERLADIRRMARATINDEREKISLRIPRSDLVRIKARAMKEGIPYQTLINSILHKELNR